MSKKAEILVVEDDSTILSLLAYVLQTAGYKVVTARTASAAWALFQEQSFDMLFLDLTLPDEDGLVLARRIRTKSDAPIVVLTARTARSDRLVALDIGVDEYLRKPVDPSELILRTRNILARRNGGRGDAGQVSQCYTFSGWVFSPGARTLTSPGGENIPLTRSEFDLLSILLLKPNQVLERSLMMDGIGRETDVANDRTIDILIGRLRKKIEKDSKNPEFIKTVPSIGYRFDANVKIVNA